MGIAVMIAIGIPAALIFLGIRVLAEYERGVVFRFGRYAGVKLTRISLIPLIKFECRRRGCAASSISGRR